MINFQHKPIFFGNDQVSMVNEIHFLSKKSIEDDLKYS